jgi:hypothetical protein
MLWMSSTSLIIINNDRIAGYETAIEETEDADLKARFSQYIQTSQACKSELVNEVNKIGGKPDEGTRLDVRFTAPGWISSPW